MGPVPEGETQKVQRLCDFKTRTDVKSVGTEGESVEVSVPESPFVSRACFG